MSWSGTTHLEEQPVLVLLSAVITGCGDLLRLGFGIETFSPASQGGTVECSSEHTLT